MYREFQPDEQHLDGESEAEKETTRYFSDCAKQLSAVADPDRLMILSELLNGSASESELTQRLELDSGRMPHHLSILKEAGLVIVERDGSERLFSLAPGVGVPAEFGSPARIMLNGCMIELPE